ncbi:MAG: CDP-diacylglycerol--serine O-phosphatidyltransferase [Porticoccus sp.]|nr:CDP-diacylglycerol--serine O-phosphatidyltransferase [Porticoccus sp.]
MANIDNKNEEPSRDNSTPIADDKTPPPLQEKARHKGIYLLPNLFTTGDMFAGFYAILAGMDGNFEAASIAIFVAMIFDGLDGTVARMTNTSSEFGVQYDSLSDMVSFGIAPAVVAFSWILNEVGKIGWAAAFIYASCAALRLARFNTQVDVVDKRYFIGIASPTAAALIAGMVWSSYDVEPTTELALVVSLIMALSGLLMVSNFRYLSLKGLDLKGKVPFVVIFAVTMALVVVIIDPPRVLFLFALIYSLSGPVMWVWRKMRPSKA